MKPTPRTLKPRTTAKRTVGSTINWDLRSNNSHAGREDWRLAQIQFRHPVGHEFPHTHTSLTVEQCGSVRLSWSLRQAGIHSRCLALPGKTPGSFFVLSVAIFRAALASTQNRAFERRGSEMCCTKMEKVSPHAAYSHVIVVPGSCAARQPPGKVSATATMAHRP